MPCLQGPPVLCIIALIGEKTLSKASYRVTFPFEAILINSQVKRRVVLAKHRLESRHKKQDDKNDRRSKERWRNEH